MRNSSRSEVAHVEENLVMAEASRALSGLDVAALGAALKINMPARGPILLRR